MQYQTLVMKTAYVCHETEFMEFIQRINKSVFVVSAVTSDAGGPLSKLLFVMETIQKICSWIAGELS